jgi:hypothetical protein
VSSEHLASLLDGDLGPSAPVARVGTAPNQLRCFEVVEEPVIAVRSMPSCWVSASRLLTADCRGSVLLVAQTFDVYDDGYVYREFVSASLRVRIVLTF